MPGGPEAPLSAQVILREADEAAWLRDFFARAGFETGELVGTSFAITAARERFAEVLGEDAVTTLADPGGGEVGAARLPPELAGRVAAVATPGRPDFGARGR